MSEIKTAKPGGATALWRTHGYDARRRLTEVSDLDGADWNESRSFAYDANGRLVSPTGPWKSTGAQASGSYIYDAPRARMRATEDRPPRGAFLDCRPSPTGGNIRSRTDGVKTSVISYDAAKNRVSTATLTGVGAAAFAYDGNFKRVKEVRAGKTIYTVYSRVSGGLVYRDEATDSKRTDYAGVGPMSFRLVNGAAPEYIHLDQQGSAVAATNPSGAVVWRESYRPYGRAMLDPPANDNNTGYTGHLVDKASGLAYMQARYYDPLIGRFYSTDPTGYQDQLNLYAYVANDPVNATDPTGMSEEDKSDEERNKPNTCSRTGGSSCSGNYSGDGFNWDGAGSRPGGPSGVTVTSSRNERGNLIINTVPNDDPSLGESMMSTEETAEIAGFIFPNAIGLAGGGVAPRGAGVSALGRGATGSAQFASETSLARHFAKHGAEFGSRSANAYRVQASRFLTGRPGAGVLQRVRATNGDIVRYRPHTNEFGVISREGTIRTYFRPNDGLEYFLNGN